MDPKEAPQQLSTRYEQAVKIFLSSPETDVEFSKQCFWELKSEYVGAGKRAGRWALYGLIFIGVFELLNRRLVSGASFSGIQIDRLSFLMYFLPPSLAFCVLNVFTIFDEQKNYEYIIKELAKQRFPGLYASNIHALFTANFGLLSAEIPKSLTSRRGHRNDFLYIVVQVIIAPIGYLIFEVYAYIELFSHSGMSIIAVVISLLVTASFIILTILRVIDILLDATTTDATADLGSEGGALA